MLKIKPRPGQDLLSRRRKAEQAELDRIRKIRRNARKPAYHVITQNRAKTYFLEVAATDISDGRELPRSWIQRGNTVFIPIPRSEISPPGRRTKPAVKMSSSKPAL
jgi:5-formyltetrahydrofolate cyclo-ligase